ncbi:EF-hand domain-containing protein [Bradyrhizobium sp. SZCCHNPS2010]|uniref:EF-hand domain-containing protein n=1 Tax=Bradyrhizobium sp. SZCCHNPS2010 TaxID=3057333 RepID=UPI002916C208|nr:EF-hand domain-containing protein [Bradyrhizobium sp. SZCCHNPS2010]
MYRHILGLTTSALLLACGTAGALAQNQTTPQPGQQTQSSPMGQDGGGMMGPGSMMGGGMMGQMMGRGAMARPLIMRVMFALMDTDSDGTLSLQEFQAAHERIFKAMDTNKDGKLTPEEMEAFIHGTK